MQLGPGNGFQFWKPRRSYKVSKKSQRERERNISKSVFSKLVLADTCMRLSVREKPTTPASPCILSCIVMLAEFVQNAQMIEKRALRLRK